MLTARLIRVEEDFDYGTFGTLVLDTHIFCSTLEPADLENKVNVSSIPVQQYICQRYSSLNHPDTFQVMNVPGRTKVLFHSGNDIDDTEGCILLGQYPGKLKGDTNLRGVWNSGNTFKLFMTYLKDVIRFHLTIKEVY